MSCNLARLYQLQLSNNSEELTDNRIGEKNMKYEKIETEKTGPPFLSRKLVKDGLKKVRIITEPKKELVVFKDKDTGKETKSEKYVCIASTNLSEPKEVKWQMNPTTSNFLDETLSPLSHDTKDWMNKDIELAVKQAGSSEPGVYPKDCSLEKVLS